MFVSYNFTVNEMLRKLFKRNKLLQEYVGELKVIYQAEIVEVFNFQELISIYEKEVMLSNITVLGNDLKVIYQDPIKVKIKGKIKSITERTKNGI